MARALRIQYENALYHVTCRGNGRENIFESDIDRKKFLELLAESVETYQIILHSYVLMDNHFHLLVSTPMANLSEFMRRFNITYTSYFNKNNQRVGHLYQGRYKSLLVEQNQYLNVVSRYIHLNPVKIKSKDCDTPKEKYAYLNGYGWSSLAGYFSLKKKEKFVSYAAILNLYGGDNSKGRENYRKIIREDLKVAIDIKKDVVGGFILGTQEFVSNVVDEFLDKKIKDREFVAVGKLKEYVSKDTIVRFIAEEFGVDKKEVLSCRGLVRQVAMEMLYKLAGMKGVKIGEIMGLDYSTVSVGRKRLRDKLQKDKKLSKKILNLERKAEMSRIKI